MDPVSTLNQYCQKHSLAMPVYEFTRTGDQEFKCVATFNGCSKIAFCSNKKDGKKVTAKQLLLSLSNEPEIIDLDADYILIDGDQRMDVWRYLLGSNSTIKVPIRVYLSKTSVLPSTFSIKSSNTVICRAKYPSKNAADALMLMDMGRLPGKLIVVSSDHILHYAALERSETITVNDLQDFKSRFSLPQSPQFHTP